MCLTRGVCTPFYVAGWNSVARGSQERTNRLRGAVTQTQRAYRVFKQRNVGWAVSNGLRVVWDVLCWDNAYAWVRSHTANLHLYMFRVNPLPLHFLGCRMAGPLLITPDIMDTLRFSSWSRSHMTMHWGCCSSMPADMHFLVHVLSRRILGKSCDDDGSVQIHY